jgi:ATP-dependent protease Clp ATPase subunit
MLDIMYDLPDQKGSGSYLITDDIVEGGKPLFRVAERKTPKTKSA